MRQLKEKLKAKERHVKKLDQVKAYETELELSDNQTFLIENLDNPLENIQRSVKQNIPKQTSEIGAVLETVKDSFYL